MRHILIVIASLIIFYFCIGLVANISQLADAADRIYPSLGQYVFWILISLFALFVVSPIVLYFKMPKVLVPPVESEGTKHQEYMMQLRNRLRNNPRLKGVSLENEEDVVNAIKLLSKEVDKAIKQTASAVFVGTAVMQNARIDGLIILITQMKMVWQIASIYNQRPSPRQMLYLYSNVGTTALLVQSIDDIDFSELVAPIVVSIIPSLKGAVPGMQGISNLLVNSLSSGAANAMLTLRVGFVAKQYCEALSSPSRQLVRRNATVSALKMIGEITKENSIQIVKRVGDTVGGMASDTVDAAVNKLKDAADKVAESTAIATQKMITAMNSSTEGIKTVTENASMQIRESTADATRNIVDAITVKALGVKNVAGKAADSVKTNIVKGAEKISDAYSSSVVSAKDAFGKLPFNKNAPDKSDIGSA